MISENVCENYDSLYGRSNISGFRSRSIISWCVTEKVRLSNVMNFKKTPGSHHSEGRLSQEKVNHKLSDISYTDKF